MGPLSNQPPVLILDTSVIIKWYRQEELLADQALSLRDAYLEGRVVLAVPSLVAYEFSNVLRFKQDLATEDVQAAVESLYEMGLEWIPQSSAVICRAVELARTYETTVYDATFAALGETLNATFVTADEWLVQQLAGSQYVRFLGDVQGL